MSKKEKDKSQEDGRDIWDKILDSKYAVPAGAALGGAIGARIGWKRKKLPPGGDRADSAALGYVLGAPLGGGAGAVASAANYVSNERKKKAKRK